MSPFLTPKAKKGRNYLKTILALFVIAQLLMIFMYLGLDRTDKLSSQLVRLALWMGLYFLVYEGKFWARHLVAFIKMTLGLFGLLTLDRLIPMLMVQNLVTIISLINLIGGGILLASTSITEFLEYQRSVEQG